MGEVPPRRRRCFFVAITTNRNFKIKIAQLSGFAEKWATSRIALASWISWKWKCSKNGYANIGHIGHIILLWRVFVYDSRNYCSRACSSEFPTSKISNFWYCIQGRGNNKYAPCRMIRLNSITMITTYPKCIWVRIVRIALFSWEFHWGGPIRE